MWTNQKIQNFCLKKRLIFFKKYVRLLIKDKQTRCKSDCFGEKQVCTAEKIRGTIYPGWGYRVVRLNFWSNSYTKRGNSKEAI